MYKSGDCSAGSNLWEEHFVRTMPRYLRHSQASCSNTCLPSYFYAVNSVVAGMCRWCGCSCVYTLPPRSFVHAQIQGHCPRDDEAGWRTNRNHNERPSPQEKKREKESKMRSVQLWDGSCSKINKSKCFWVNNPIATGGTVSDAPWQSSGLSWSIMVWYHCSFASCKGYKGYKKSPPVKKCDC